MGQGKRGGMADTERRDIIANICLTAGALMNDPDIEGEITSAEDPEADQAAFAQVFRAWVDGKLGGTADEVFEATKTLLEE
jgi:hypothetical protein